MTPRKPKHQQQPSGGGGGHRRQPSQNQAQSQSQSQSQQYAPQQGAVRPSDASGVHMPTSESLYDMNLRVLRRYEPTIRTIEAIAVSSVVYVIDPVRGGWVKSDPQIEGTLFLCEQEPLVIEPYRLPRACIFMLNRKDPDNVVIDLARVGAAETANGLISLSIEEEPGQVAEDGTTISEPTPSFALGLWVHGTPGIDGTVFDPEVVLQRWRGIREAIKQQLGTDQLAQTAGFLDAAATLGKMNREGQGQAPGGVATAAFPPQAGLKQIVDKILGYQAEKARLAGVQTGGGQAGGYGHGS